VPYKGAAPDTIAAYQEVRQLREGATTLRLVAIAGET
jgi:hypothetical protein